MPEKVNGFIELFAATRNKIEVSEGCRGIELLNDVKKANVFFTYSKWDSEKHLEYYRNSELFKDTWAKTKAMFVNKAEAWSMKKADIERKK